MALKDMFKAIAGKQKPSEQEKKEEAIQTLITDEQFPIIRPADMDIKRYDKVPLAGLAALGGAFAMLPEGARTMMQTVTKTVQAPGNLYIGINPKGIMGKLQGNANGINGNIMQMNAQGKSVIKGRMAFQPVENLSVTQTTGTVMPFNPMTIAVAAALYNIDQKLITLQAKAEEILQFLKLEKQSRQRGNLHMLAEILDEYKQNCQDEKRCSLRNVEVQAIKREAHQDILFYQEQIARQLKEQKGLHLAQDAQGLLENVMGEFYEYQLACYLYAFSTFLDVMLQKNFASTVLESAAKKMEELAKKYADLYRECREQIADYQRNAIDVKAAGALGRLATSMGQKAADVRGLNRLAMDEKLMSWGEGLVNQNREAVAKKLEAFAPLEDSRMTAFIENVQRLDYLYHREDGLITDGEYLYMLRVAS